MQALTAAGVSHDKARPGWMPHLQTHLDNGRTTGRDRPYERDEVALPRVIPGSDDEGDAFRLLLDLWTCSFSSALCSWSITATVTHAWLCTTG